MKANLSSQKKNSRGVFIPERAQNKKVSEKIAEIVKRNQKQNKPIDLKDYFTSISKHNNYLSES